MKVVISDVVMVHKPDIRVTKDFWVSTCHITKKDDILLGELVLERYVVDTDYGYSISLRAYNGEKAKFTEIGLSDSFINLMCLTERFKCDNLILDCDGMVYDELEKFVW